MARNRKRKGDPVHGWLCLDKPLDMTSTQAVGSLKRLYNAQKVGHGGTLDPLATGILPIAFGNATKTVAWAMDADKDYEFTVTWGVATASYDAEGVEIARSDVRPDKQAIEAALPAFIGEIEQVPPKFSAIKVDGQRAYDLARDGEDFELEARSVTVHEARLVSVEEGVSATFHVRSGKGFYVRAMARDMAHALGTEGHITALRRTRVGVFEESNAVGLKDLQDLGEQGDADALMSLLAPIETALEDIPLVDISAHDAAQIFNGQSVILLPHVVDHWKENRSSNPDDDRLAVAMDGDRAVAIGEVRAGRFQPVR
ncbi:MAG: tRNA pseudouridine(55) synthase TruB, partial [Pseudomonadota bacterium]